jgi:hypothetical protein
VKHGLRFEMLPLQVEDPAAIRELSNSWFAHDQPACADEAGAVGRAVRSRRSPARRNQALPSCSSRYRPRKLPVTRTRFAPAERGRAGQPATTMR